MIRIDNGRLTLSLAYQRDELFPFRLDVTDRDGTVRTVELNRFDVEAIRQYLDSEMQYEREPSQEAVPMAVIKRIRRYMGTIDEIRARHQAPARGVARIVVGHLRGAAREHRRLRPRGQVERGEAHRRAPLAVLRPGRRRPAQGPRRLRQNDLRSDGVVQGDRRGAEALPGPQAGLQERLWGRGPGRLRAVRVPVAGPGDARPNPRPRGRARVHREGAPVARKEPHLEAGPHGPPRPGGPEGRDEDAGRDPGGVRGVPRAVRARVVRLPYRRSGPREVREAVPPVEADAEGAERAVRRESMGLDLFDEMEVGLCRTKQRKRWRYGSSRASRGRTPS